jgi:rubrerythrin
MKEQTQVGLNRTGIQMSPLGTAEITPASTAATPATPGDDSALSALRGTYIVNADPVGSVPLPGTVKEAVTIADARSKGEHPEMLLDKLGERLAFERTGVRLYDALITKLDTTQEGTPSMAMEDLQQIRNDEARHFSILADAIASLGGDPTAQTPCADVVGVECQGLMQVVIDPRTTLAQSLHAVLVAEMADQNGWEMLIALAEDNGQNAMATDFDVALNDERRHLQQIQRWYEEATLGISISDEATDIDDVRPPIVH